MNGTTMFYGGIALAVLGLVLLIVQLVGMKKRKKLAREAAGVSDIAPVAVGKPARTTAKTSAEQNAASKDTAYDSTVKLGVVQQELDSVQTVYESTVKLQDAQVGKESPETIEEYQKTEKLAPQQAVVPALDGEDQTVRLEG